MKVDQKMDEASLSSMITGFLAGEKKAMNKKLQKNKLNKKFEKFWDESVSLTESILNEETKVRAKHPQTKEFYNGVVVGIKKAEKQAGRAPLGGAQDQYKIKWDADILPAGAEEVSVVPKFDVRQFERPETEEQQKARLFGSMPRQYIGGKQSVEKKLSDEHDPQMTTAADSFKTKLDIPDEQIKNATFSDKDETPQELEANSITAAKEKQLAATDAGDRKDKLRVFHSDLKEKVDKRLRYYLNNDPEFASEWRKLSILAKDGNREAQQKQQKIRVDIIQQILSSENLSTKKGIEASVGKAASKEKTLENVAPIAVNFINSILPKIKSGNVPSHQEINFLKNFLGLDIVTDLSGKSAFEDARIGLSPQKVSQFMKMIGGKDEITKEDFLSSPLAAEIQKNTENAKFLNLPLDVFPGKFIDKIERIANEKNIPSATERRKAGESGGIGYGVRRFVNPKYQKDPKNKLPSNLEKASISRSKVGFTKLKDALAELPPEEAVKIFNYFSANQSEIQDALKNRVNRSEEFSRGAIGVPGKPEFSTQSLIGSEKPESIFDKKERSRIRAAQDVQAREFEKNAPSRLQQLMSQDEDDTPIPSAPSYKVDERDLPDLKTVWNKLIDVSKQGQGGIVDDVIQRAADTINADPADVGWVLNQMIKKDKKTGKIVGLKNPEKEPIENLDEEEMSLAPRIYYLLSPEVRLVDKPKTKSGKREKNPEFIGPSVSDFAQSEAEKLKNRDSLKDFISTREEDEFRDAENAKRNKVSEFIKTRPELGIDVEKLEDPEVYAKALDIFEKETKKPMDPDEIESINTRERLGRSKVASGLRSRREQLSSEQDKLERELERYVVGLPSASNDVELIKALAQIDPEKIKDKKFARAVKQSQKTMAKLANLNKISGINNLLIQFAKAKKDPAKYEKYQKMLATVMRPIKINWFGETEPLASRVRTLRDIPKEKNMYIPDDKFGKPSVGEKKFLPLTPDETPKTPRMSQHSGEVKGVSGSSFAYDKESQQDADRRLAQDMMRRARKIVAKSGGSLPKSGGSTTALKRALKLLLKKDEFKSLSDKSPEEILSLLKESRTLSIMEFITIPGKKKLTNTEIKEKDWQKGKPESKKKWVPTFEKKKKRKSKKC
jgi:hypothetical protein